MVIISLQKDFPMTDKFTAPSFADYIVGQRKRPVTFLDKIDKLKVQEDGKQRWKTCISGTADVQASADPEVAQPKRSGTGGSIIRQVVIYLLQRFLPHQLFT